MNINVPHVFYVFLFSQNPISQQGMPGLYAQLGTCILIYKESIVPSWFPINV